MASATPKHTRVEADLVGADVDLFAYELAEINAGLTPADSEYITPSQLATILILTSLAAAHYRPVRTFDA